MRKKFIFCCTLLACTNCQSWGKFWSTAGATTAEIKLSEVVPAYSGFPLWNDYIANDGSAQVATIVSSSAFGSTGTTTRLSASGTACNSAATGGYNVCLHAGMLRAATLTGKKDCTGVTASDNLSAFQWLCAPSSDAVKIVAVGFQDGKYMSDLVDFTAVGFRHMSLSVTADSQTFKTTETKWYENTVVNYSGGGLSVPSRVYLVQANPSTQILATADKTALLVKKGVKLTVGAGVEVVHNGAKNFNWYEVVTDLNNTATQGVLASGRFVVVQDTASVNPATGGSPRNFHFDANSYGRALRAANGTATGQIGLVIAGGAIIINGITNTNHYSTASISGSDVVIQNSIFANYTNEFQIGASESGGMFLSNTHANRGGVAVWFGSVATNKNHTFMNFAAANTNGLDAVLGGGKLQIINYASHQLTGNGIALGQPGNFLSGALRVTAGSACSASGGNEGIITATCGQQGASDFILSTGINPTNSFGGKVAVNEAANTSDSNGTTTYALGIDWINFENRFRGYGLDSGAFPIAGNQGSCTAATCRIWDWSLRSTDTEYRNLLAVPNGNNTAIHKWSATTAGNCTQPGATWVASNLCDKPPYTEAAGTCVANGGTVGAGCITTFLRNAYEQLEDGIGNENGLCESNEVCIYTPNIGAYQGHGNLQCVRGSQSGCAAAFSGGTISGVTLLQYGSNGY